jgi:uncharacterized protein YukE
VTIPFAPHAWSELGWQDPAPGDVDEVSIVRKACEDCAVLAGEVSSGLQQLSVAGGSWEGQAADAFQQRLGDLRPHLERVQRSFERAEQAISGYAAALPGMQARAATLLAQAIAAEHRGRSAVAASTQVFSLTIDPAVTAAVADLNRIKSEVDGLDDEHRAAVRTCLAGLGDAADLGMRNKPWGWTRLHDFTEKLRDLTKWVSAGAFVLGLFAGEFPPAALVLEGVALWASRLTLLFDSALVADDRIYNRPTDKDMQGLEVDGVFYGVSQGFKGAATNSEQTALKSSGQAAEADKQFGQALAKYNGTEADRLLAQKSVYDDATQEAIKKAKIYEAAHEVTDGINTVNDGQEMLRNDENKAQRVAP